MDDFVDFFLTRPSKSRSQAELYDIIEGSGLEGKGEGACGGLEPQNPEGARGEAGFRVWGSDGKVSGLEVRVMGFGGRVQGVGCRVYVVPQRTVAAAPRRLVSGFVFKV